jgi:aromatic-L-amino-acid/L-tryptophan decarboxylase
MIDQIKKLESEARALEPSPLDRQNIRKSVVDYGEHFLNSIATANAYNKEGSRGEGLLNAPFTDDPGNIDELMALIGNEVDYPGLNPASGGHLGYIPGGGIYYAALGDYLACVSNRFAGLYYASPGAVRMENMIIRWLCELMGLGPGAFGNLTSGGSVANLIAIVTARDAKKLNDNELGKKVIYITRQVHHSVDKAIRIAGMANCVTRYVPMDRKFKMDAGALQKMIVIDRKSGLIPSILIASAGTTDTGAVDPLRKLGEIAGKNELWYHIDAAYGGFFYMTQQGKERLDGIGMADSLVVDPHKGMFLPYGIGAVLVKNAQFLRDSHYYMPGYLMDSLSATEESSPADMSPELTKHFRGLRMWLPLKIHGLNPFRAALDEKLLLAKYFYDQIKNTPGFEVVNEPDLSVVVYRFVPKKGDPDEFNRKLLDKVLQDGRIFISSTRIGGSFMLRLAILSFRTHLDTIEMALSILKTESANLEKEEI